MLALLDALSMPFVLLAMGASALGCMAWSLLIIFFVMLGGLARGGGTDWAIAAWTLAAIVLGFWNFGRFMDYFGDADGKLVGIAKALAVSAGLVATNPLLWYAWLS
jgi:hypothetical protein